jgi:hypothetical protein
MPFPGEVSRDKWDREGCDSGYHRDDDVPCNPTNRTIPHVPLPGTELRKLISDGLDREDFAQGVVCVGSGVAFEISIDSEWRVTGVFLRAEVDVLGIGSYSSGGFFGMLP